MVKEYEVHKRTIIILFQMAVVIGALVLFFYALSALISPGFAVGVLVFVPILSFIYAMLYTEIENRMMEEKKWKEFNEDLEKNGRYSDN